MIKGIINHANHTSKLAAWVRFPSPAPPSTDVRGFLFISNPVHPPFALICCSLPLQSQAPLPTCDPGEDASQVEPSVEPKPEPAKSYGQVCTMRRLTENSYCPPKLSADQRTLFIGAQFFLNTIPYYII